MDAFRTELEVWSYKPVEAWRWGQPRAGDARDGRDMQVSRTHQPGLSIPWEQLHPSSDDADCARVYRYTGHFEEGLQG